MTAPTQRVERLEAAAFRTDRDIAAVNDQLEAVNGRLDLLSGAVSELSGDVRELRTDMTELRADVTGLHGKVDRLEMSMASQGVLLAAIAQKLGVEDQGVNDQAL
ncbi:DUF5798 family protein [Catellatospora chokoriensis]|uniref:Uncharacterized protein n=1 Tax=Catellatospora chokoriensis TaxID=310353 RepID=A0A8J3JQB1_9ACTN|nr:DUF5798 family protein [Catellatospora chokoriensis]GIF89151.1 hypothetical protein Cch02nite_25950 [Catellatospora chokoriensis]